MQWLYDMATQHCPGLDGLLVEPDFETFDDVFMKTWRKVVPGEGPHWRMATSNRGHGKQIEITCPGGLVSTIYVRSAMNAQTVERIDGLMTISYVGLDEIARAKAGKRAWELSVSRCRVPSPIGNHILVVGKPNGFNWTADAFGCTEDHPPQAWETGYESRMPGRGGDGSGQLSFIRAGKTSDNAKHLGDGYEDTLLAFGERFAKENVYGSLVHTQGAIFPGWHKPMHVISNEEADMMWARAVVKKACGGDYGFGSFSAWLTTGATGDGDMLCIDEWYKHNALLKDIAYNGARMRRRWGVRSFPYDSANTGIIAEIATGCMYKGDLERVSAFKADKDFEQGAGKLRDLMEFFKDKVHPFKLDEHGRTVKGSSKFFVAERCVNLCSEFSKYREKEEVTDTPLSERTVGHDHLIDCCRYAALELFGRTEYGSAGVVI